MPLAFTDAMREQAARRGRHWLVFIIGATLVWWPLDALVYAGDAATQATFTWLRLVTLPLHVVLLAAFVGLARARHHAPLVLVVYHTVVVALLAHAMARLGPPSSPWPGYLYMAIAPAMALPLDGALRVVGTLAPGASALTGYFVTRPAHLDDPHALSVMSFMGFVVLVTYALGVLLQRFQRRLFFQSVALAKTTATLERLNESLRDDERKRIARELHDELGQDLTAARYTLGVARLRDDPRADLDDLERLLARTTRTVKEVIGRLRPQALDELGLEGALRWLADEVRRAGLGITLVLDPLPALGREREATIFRFVQEALTNVVRHAGARRAEVVALVEDGVEVVVSDDGRGLAGHVRGHGLTGMHERAAAIGGAIVLGQSASGGAKVSLRLPLQQAAA